MKPQAALSLLPAALLLSSCFTQPYYPEQGPPYNPDGSPYYPYGQAQGGYRSPEAQPYGGYQTEQGNYQQVPPPIGSRPPANNVQRPDPTSRPIPPSYDVDEEGGGASRPPVNPPPSGNSNTGGGGGFSRSDVPLAKPTDNPSRVISPFPPYNIIDVSEVKSGHLAKDPSTGKTFRVP